MPTAGELAWMLAAGAFGLLVALASFLAKKDREEISGRLLDLSRALDEIEKEMRAMRREIHEMLIDHERRIVRLETKIYDKFGDEAV